MPALCRQTCKPGTAGGVIYWVDAQLPPQLASWLSETFKVEAYSLRDLQLRDAEDTIIFEAAQRESVVIIIKDSDFVDMVLRLGTPPQLLWVTCGNVTNRRLQELFAKLFPRAQELLLNGEAVVEIANLGN